MATRRKNNPQADQTIKQPLPGMETVKVIKEYTQPIQPTGEPTTKSNVTFVTEPTEDFPPDPNERIYNFLEQIRGEQNWRLVVFRLPNFNRDGRTDMRGPKVYCGNIPFEPDSYLDTIQDLCPEGGTFKIQAKNPEGQFSEQWIEHLMPIRKNANSQQVFLAAPLTAATAPPVDTMDQFLTFAKRASEIREALGWQTPSQATAPAPAVEIERQAPLTERLTDALVMKLVETGKPDALDRALDAITGKREPTWVETIINDVIKPLIPAVLPLAQMFIQNAAARQAAMPQPAQIPAGNFTGRLPDPLPGQNTWPPVANQASYDPSQRAAPPGYPQGFQPQPQPQSQAVISPFQSQSQGTNYMPQSSTPIAPVHGEQNNSDDPFSELTEYLFEALENCIDAGMVDLQAIESSHAKIQAFCNQYPNLAGFVMNFAKGKPETTLGMMIASQPEIQSWQSNPVAIEAIKALQEKILGIAS
jgi:hypothetical protein